MEPNYLEVVIYIAADPEDKYSLPKAAADALEAVPGQIEWQVRG